MKINPLLLGAVVLSTIIISVIALQYFTYPSDPNQLGIKILKRYCGYKSFEIENRTWKGQQLIDIFEYEHFSKIKYVRNIEIKPNLYYVMAIQEQKDRYIGSLCGEYASDFLSKGCLHAVIIENSTLNYGIIDLKEAVEYIRDNVGCTATLN